MCYAEEHWVKPTDVRTAVERLQQQFQALQFDAEHEQIYGCNRFYTDQECVDLENRYTLGIELCVNFLQNKMCVRCLLSKLKQQKLGRFVGEIEVFLKKEVECESV